MGVNLLFSPVVVCCPAFRKISYQSTRVPDVFGTTVTMNPPIEDAVSSPSFLSGPASPPGALSIFLSDGLIPCRGVKLSPWGIYMSSVI